MTAVFLIDLDDPALSTPDRFLWLDDEERSRAVKFRAPRLSQRFIAGHVALRFILGGIVGRQPSAIAFGANAWGRPELAGGPFFNLSHSESVGIVAVDDNAPVGVDVELPDRRIEADWLNDVLCPEEKSLVATGLLDAASLTRLWVRKEAVLKALGRGLSYSPSLVPIGVDPPDYKCWRSVHLESGGVVEQFRLVDLPIGSDAIAALARAGSDACAMVDLKRLSI